MNRSTSTLVLLSVAVLTIPAMGQTGPAPAVPPHFSVLGGVADENRVGAHSRPFSSGPVLGFGSWPTYLHDNQRTGHNANDTGITASDASQLALAWSDEINRSILGSLIVVNGTAYVGSRNGYLNAFNAVSGQPLGPQTNPSWARPNLGTPYYSTCGGGSATAAKQSGVISTPTLWNGQLYEMGGTTRFYSLALDGTILGQVDIGNASKSPWYYEYNWASPLVYNGSAYVGTAALCEYNGGSPVSTDWKYIQGQLLEADLSSGTITHRFNVTQDSSVSDVGGSIWSTASADPSTNIVWVTTGNENLSTQTPANGEYPRAVVALNATTLRVLGSCQVGSVGADNDFGAGPTLFHGAKGARYVGAINKDGTFSAYNASTPTGGTCNGGSAPSLRLAWSDSFCTGGGSGPLSPAAFDDSRLYVASSGCTNSSGHVDAIDPDTGKVLWDHSLYQPPAIVLGGLTTANGLVFVTANNNSQGNAAGLGELQVLNATSGALLFQRIFNTSLAAAPVVADGTVYVGLGNFSGTGPGYVDAFRLPLPVAATVVGGQCTGTGALVCRIGGSIVQVRAELVNQPGIPTCEWEFGDGSTAGGCAASHRFASPGGYSLSLVVSASGRVAARTVGVLEVAAPNATVSVLGQPTPRSLEAVAMESASGPAVLFGGTSTQSSGPVVLGDTWTYSRYGWTNVTASMGLSPPPLTGAAAAVDPDFKGVILYGGTSSSPVAGEAGCSAETWLFSQGRWTNLTANVSGVPGPLWGASMVYDASLRGLLLYGGVTFDGSGLPIVSNVTWSLMYGPAGPTWSAFSTSSPPSRAWASMTADARDGSLLLFGGTADGTRWLNETWVFFPRGWSQGSPTIEPTPGPGAILAQFDPRKPVVYWSGLLPSVTWEYTNATWTSVRSSEAPGPPAPASGAAFWVGGYILTFVGNSTWGFDSGGWTALPLSATLAASSPLVDAGQPVTLTVSVHGGFSPLAFLWTVQGIAWPATGPTVVLSFTTTGSTKVGVQVVDASVDIANSTWSTTVHPALSAGFAAPSAEAGLPAGFQANASGGEAPFTYVWDFGDGSPVGTSPNVTHIFASAGNYVTALTVVDGSGALVTFSELEGVRPPPSVINWTGIHGTDIGVNTSIGFVVVGGLPPYSASIVWTGGSTQTLMLGTDGSAAVHPRFTAAGNETLTVRVVDALGGSVATSVALAVNPPPIVELSGPERSSSGDGATFQASVTGGTPPYSYHWFVDGQPMGSSHSDRFTFLTSTPGTHTVACSVTDGAGLNASAGMALTVTSPGAALATLLVAAGTGATIAAAALAAILRARRRRPLSHARDLDEQVTPPSEVE